MVSAKQISNSARNLALILNSIPDLIMQVDADLKIVWANKATLKLAPDAIGQFCYVALPCRDTRCPNCPIVRVLETGQIEQGVVHQKNIPGIGESYWDDIGIPIKDAEGRVISVVKVASNITEKVYAEAEKGKFESQLRQAAKMESIGRLAGGVAHDYNNMLGVIIGYTDMILGQMDQSHPLHSDLVRIKKAGESSADLTRQLLAFARKQIVSPRVIDPNQTLDNMLQMLTRLIGEDIDMAWIPGDGVWPIKIDSIQMDQILINLCVNARDAIADTGKITIETSNIVVDEKYCEGHVGCVPGEYVLLIVSDNGCGMDAKTMENIFDPFYTTKKSGKGTGLGLATVYGAVKQNSGFINVYSEPGHGTTFRLYLPRYDGQVVETTKTKARHLRHGSETILLAEDEPALLEMATTMLQSIGYRVLAAGTPREAIAFARDHVGEVHLLLTDVVMPQMNGKELVGELLNLYPGLNVLYTSGYTADVIARHGILEEGVNFIQKPFSTDVLAGKVREALDK